MDKGLIVVVYALASLTTVPRLFSIGNITLMGWYSIILFFAVLFIWFVMYKGRIVNTVFIRTIVIHFIYIAILVVINGINIDGIQDLLILYTFFLIINIYAINAAREPSSVQVLIIRTIEVFSAAGIIGLLVVYFVFGVEKEIISPASASLFLLPFLALSLADMRAGRVRGFIRYGIVLGTFLMTLSRTPTAIALILLVLAYWGERKWINRLTSLALVLMIATVVMWSILNNERLYEGYFGGDSAIQYEGITINTSGRATIYRIVWDSFVESPFFGKGVGSVSETLSAAGLEIKQAHNDYLRILHDTGLVGLLILGSIFMLLWKELNRAERYFTRMHYNRETQRLIRASKYLMVGLLLSMITDNTIVYSHAMYPAAILFGYVSGTYRRERVRASGRGRVDKVYVI